MASISRAALKAQFKSGAAPTPQDYFNLVDSTLVKRDDAFFGKWQPGVSYQPGDVVIYERVLYICKATKEDCPCADDKPQQETPGTENSTFCSKEPPDQDKRWEPLKMEDDDWEVVKKDPPEKDIMYAKVTHRIGMGTTEPLARVHIQDDETGSDFLFNAAGAATATFTLQQGKNGNTVYCTQQLLTDSVFVTNAAGFLFGHTQPDSGQAGQKLQEGTAATPMVYMTMQEDKVAIGVSTVTPQAAVDIQATNTNHILLNPLQKTTTETISLYRTADEESATETYLATAVIKNAAVFTTNTPGGFYFRKGPDDFTGYLQGETPTAGGPASPGSLVTIHTDGKVGIGTENPHAHLEVTDNNSGRFLLSLQKANPAFSIINTNLGPDKKPNYLSIGTDNDQSTFVTNAPSGFVFRKGGPYGAKDNEVNINQGKVFFTVRPEGKVGIGPEFSGDYELELYGNARMFSLYLYTDEKNISNHNKMGSVLANVKLLNPLVFNWDNSSTNCNEDKQNVGFLAHELEKLFPEVVTTHKKEDDGEQTKAVAYPNMVAILAKAIQEQQSMIEELKQQVEKLGGKGNSNTKA